MHRNWQSPIERCGGGPRSRCHPRSPRGLVSVHVSRMRELAGVAKGSSRTDESHRGMATGVPGAKPDPTSSYLLILLLAMVAIGLSISGVFLLVTCETTEFTNRFGNTLGCAYPFQIYGEVFLYVASLVVTFELFPIHGVLLARGHRPIWNPRHIAIVTVASLTMLFWVVYFLM